MAKNVNASKLLINRELSWLEFNHRVLREGTNPDVPLLERVKFLAIVSSNLDEFFMVRVAGLKQQKNAGIRKKDPSGLTPAGQLNRIARRVGQMVDDQTAGIHEVMGLLDEHDIHLVRMEHCSDEQKQFLDGYFQNEVMPTLTPIAMDELEHKPLLPGLRLHLAMRLHKMDEPEAESVVAVVPIPQALPRFVTLPAERGLYQVLLEDVVAFFAARLFPGFEILSRMMFRITRDGDVPIDMDDAGDLLASVEEAIRQRNRREVVRLELSGRSDPQLKAYLKNLFAVRPAEIYEIDGMLDAKALMDLAARPGWEHLKYEEWPPQRPRDLLDSEDLYASLRDHDVLHFLPYEAFDPVIELVQQAADDPQVLAIKQTLYRTTGDSPIVAALMRAARNGKQVTVLVELKARFDESRNVGWARALEDAGCDVIYGVVGLKTHSKVLLIVRREEYGIRRYLHLSTGNYNDKTAKLYSDIGLMTTDRELADDAAALFNLLTGYSQVVGWSKMTVAPTGLRDRFLELIDREIRVSTKAQPGLIMAKMNSLQDPEICRALYRASQAGVKVMLNIRGICCLRPGVKGVSENIEVTSIIDRFLEHARIYYFRNGGHEEVYLSSADWMVRNLDKRMETLFPVLAGPQHKRVVNILRTFFTDNVKSWCMNSDGTYEPPAPGSNPIRAQEVFYREAVEIVREASQTRLQFQPIRKKK
jgi:polyphosphate kinase